MLELDELAELFEYADRYGFVIASDECYSEIYSDEDAPPLGALRRRARAGPRQIPELVVFTSLSKRSNAPGLRSGGVAGDAALVEAISAVSHLSWMRDEPPVQHASIAAWGDETHVRDNRTHYRAKFDAVVPMLEGVLDTADPDASFYLWAGVRRGATTRRSRAICCAHHVTVLPGVISRATRTATIRAPAMSASRSCRASTIASGLPAESLHYCEDAAVDTESSCPPIRSKR